MYGDKMINLFDQISTKNKDSIIKKLEANKLFYKKNTNILEYIKINKKEIVYIENGSLQLIKIDYNGNKYIVDNYINNEIINFKTLVFSTSKYELNTLEDTNIVLFDYEYAIKQLINTSYYIQFIINLLKISTDVAYNKTERLEIITKTTIRDKLLAYFDIKYKKTGSKNIYLPISMSEFADYLAVNRSAMSRELKYLKEEGFIDIKNKKIILLYK